MNTKPLDTPFEDFTAEEITAMDDDEMFARSVHTAGDLGKMITGIAVEASGEIMSAIQLGRTLADAMKLSGDEDSDPTGAVAPLVGEIIIGSVLAAMSVAREAERYHVANPDFPDTDTVEVFGSIQGALNGALGNSEAHA